MTKWREEIIGDARLICADCREVLPTLPRVDAVVTSPPYNQLGERMPSKPSGIWRDMGRGFLDSVNSRGYADDMDETEYQADQNAIFALIPTKPTASLFYNHQCRWRDGELLHPVMWFRPAGWAIRQEIIWDRCGGMMFNARMFCRFDERVLWFSKGEHKWNQESVGHGTIWRVPRETNKEHPVAYPAEIAGRCIESATDPGDLVLDPYAGSASTGVACIKLGRKFIGIEIAPKYFDIACRRIEEAWKQPRLFEEPKPKAEQGQLELTQNRGG